MTIAVYSNSVDWSGRHETPAGLAGQGETPQARMRRGGSPTARGKRSAWSGNQQARLTQPIVKKKRCFHLRSIAFFIR